MKATARADPNRLVTAGLTLWVESAATLQTPPAGQARHHRRPGNCLDLSGKSGGLSGKSGGRPQNRPLYEALSP